MADLGKNPQSDVAKEESPGLLVRLFSGFFEWLGKLFSPSKTANLVILGTKGTGKTTLWKGLGGLSVVKSNTTIEPVRSFKFVRTNGTEVKVSSTYDIGGEVDFVAYYGDLIINDCFVYYLVDSTKVRDKDYMVRIRSDIRKLNKVLNDKGITKFGIKFLLTHFYKYQLENSKTCSEYDLYREFANGLGKSKGKGLIGERLSEKDYQIIMLAVELNEKKAQKLGKNYVEIIKNEIGG